MSWFSVAYSEQESYRSATEALIMPSSLSQTIGFAVSPLLSPQEKAKGGVLLSQCSFTKSRLDGQWCGVMLLWDCPCSWWLTLETVVCPHRNKHPKPRHNDILECTRMTMQMPRKLQHYKAWQWHIPEMNYDVLLLIWQCPLGMQIHARTGQNLSVSLNKLTAQTKESCQDKNYILFSSCDYLLS